MRGTADQPGIDDRGEGLGHHSHDFARDARADGGSGFDRLHGCGILWVQIDLCFWQLVLWQLRHKGNVV